VPGVKKIFPGTTQNYDEDRIIATDILFTS
jgi:hypothetical protein